MKELCSNFDIIPVKEVASLTNEEVIPVEGSVFDTFSTESWVINPSPENTDAGLSVAVSQNVVIDKISTDIATKYNYTRYCILIVYFTDGTHAIYGSKTYPVEVYLIPGMQRDTLYLSLQTPIIPVI